MVRAHHSTVSFETYLLRYSKAMLKSYHVKILALVAYLFHTSKHSNRTNSMETMQICSHYNSKQSHSSKSILHFEQRYIHAIIHLKTIGHIMVINFKYYKTSK